MAFKLDLTPTGTLTVECVENGPVTTNTYFAISGDEAVVIDPAWDGEALAEHFAAKHPDVRIIAAIATHGHADHIGGVWGLRAALGEDLPFLISEADVAMIEPSIKNQHESWGIDTPAPGEPARLLAEGDVIEVGDARLQVFSTPGHTPGGIILFAATTAGEFAFVGDTLFPGGHGRTDLLGGDTGAVYQSLAKLATLMPKSTLCLIGHGPTTTVAAEREGNLFMRRALRHYGN